MAVLAVQPEVFGGDHAEILTGWICARKSFYHPQTARKEKQETESLCSGRHPWPRWRSFFSFCNEKKIEMCSKKRKWWKIHLTPGPFWFCSEVRWLLLWERIFGFGWKRRKKTFIIKLSLLRWPAATSVGWMCPNGETWKFCLLFWVITRTKLWHRVKIPE